MSNHESGFQTRESLRADLHDLGVSAGDVILVHAAMSKLGRLLNGPDVLIGALLDQVGATGTIMAYTDWDARYDELLDEDGHLPSHWRKHIPPFCPLTSRANRENGIFPEFLRTMPGARRSGNPGASMTALGAQSDWLTKEHDLNYGYGENSPLAKLVAANGKVLMVGAPLDTMTLLHHAEHLARIPNKKVRRYEVPLATMAGVEWTVVEEFETADPVVEGLSDDYFGDVVQLFLDESRGRRGLIGHADSVLVDARRICDFGVAWLERRFG